MSQQRPLPPGPPPPGMRPQYLPPPAAYPPGQPLPPRRRQPRHSPVIAPVLALLGLVLIAGGSLSAYTLISQQVPAPESGALTGPAAESSAGPESTGDPEFVEPTPDPALPTLAPLVAVGPLEDRPEIKGTILFSRDGDIWSASGKTLEKVTGQRTDYSPTWSPDGKYIYFQRVNKKTTNKTRLKGLYTFFVPEITRINADGSNKVRIYNGFISGPGGQWFSHVLQPDVSPDGKTLAVVSDGPNGSGEAVVLHLIDTKPKSKMRKVAGAPTSGDLGHNDPAWRPDGKAVAYTRNERKGTTGVPRVTILTCKSKQNCTSGRSRALKAGTASPSWSPDGGWLAVEITNGLGRDIAIVNAQRGDVRIVLTDDGDSFAPVVSPNGDQIAYLHRDGLNIDLRVMTLDFGDNDKITLVSDQAVTVDGAIDAESPPAWHIPKSVLTRPVATATASDASAPPTESPTDAP